MTIIKSIDDEEFLRRKVPLTKKEIRILTISELGIEENDTVLDIGAGTGGLTIQASFAAPSGKIYAVEKNPDAVVLIKENLKKFERKNVEIIKGDIKDVLNDFKIKPNKIIIGGSGGNLEKIIDWSKENLAENGKIVANFITIENVSECLKLFKENFDDVNVILASISKSQFAGNVTLMKAENPIYILSAKKR